jgi:hypothetical protein
MFEMEVERKVDVEIEIWNHEQLVVLNEIILNDLEIIHEQQVVRIKMLLRVHEMMKECNYI